MRFYKFDLIFGIIFCCDTVNIEYAQTALSFVPEANNQNKT